jgi:23S rRNA-/tRNA-specific pseudouridylate synthase
VDNDGQFALTKFRLLKVEKEPKLGYRYLLECIPITGRTHQLRAHLLSIGLPILGDKRYYEEQSSSFLKQFFPNRLYLHAWKLSFRNPVNGKWEDFEAPVPDAFKKIFNSALEL